MRPDPASLGLPPADLLHMHRKMWAIRAFEERAIELFTAGELPGFLHSQIGQEATCVGTCAALDPEDWITSTHRGHGDIIAKGGRLDRMMAELYGRETGYCRGKGGSMHLFDFGLGILGANGIVGAGLPIAVGAALSARLRGTAQVSVSFFGDGASNEGAFHEALNLASTWQLPVVFVCQNNEYAESTPRRVQQAIADIATRGAAYGVPGVVVDGMDVLAVREVVSAAVERGRDGGGPTLVEAKTYRFYGHYVGDPGVYRPSEEVEAWKQRDPIRLFEARLAEAGVLGREEADQVEAEVRQEVDDAVEFARASPEPDPASAFEDVYA
ncbi:MAG TPA: thiamine pyrophosphate-dependent dehydrogenase E1 component subunit alpha [Gaiellaceae bacterium]|nr:thiamine pyrophosphate-dependent dehydrogenase E1 component subunit alpha [Gaiellaceae bacterium]